MGAGGLLDVDVHTGAVQSAVVRDRGFQDFSDWRGFEEEYHNAAEVGVVRSPLCQEGPECKFWAF